MLMTVENVKNYIDTDENDTTLEAKLQARLVNLQIKTF